MGLAILLFFLEDGVLSPHIFEDSVSHILNCKLFIKPSKWRKHATRHLVVKEEMKELTCRCYSLFFFLFFFFLFGLKVISVKQKPFFRSTYLPTSFFLLQTMYQQSSCTKDSCSIVNRNCIRDTDWF